MKNARLLAVGSLLTAALLTAHPVAAQPAPKDDGQISNDLPRGPDPKSALPWLRPGGHFPAGASTTVKSAGRQRAR